MMTVVDWEVVGRCGLRPLDCIRAPQRLLHETSLSASRLRKRWHGHQPVEVILDSPVWPPMTAHYWTRQTRTPEHSRRIWVSEKYRLTNTKPLKGRSPMRHPMLPNSGFGLC